MAGVGGWEWVMGGGEGIERSIRGQSLALHGTCACWSTRQGPRSIQGLQALHLPVPNCHAQACALMPHAMPCHARCVRHGCMACTSPYWPAAAASCPSCCCSREVGDPVGVEHAAVAAALVVDLRTRRSSVSVGVVRVLVRRRMPGRLPVSVWVRMCVQVCEGAMGGSSGEHSFRRANC